MANINRFDNKIEAIKAVRAIPLAEITLERNASSGQLELYRAPMGLKESKDMVEAIMALGVRQFLADALFDLKRSEAIAAGGLPPERSAVVSDRICGAQDNEGHRWCCNLVPGHTGPHRDHVSQRHFYAGTEVTEDIKF